MDSLNNQAFTDYILFSSCRSQNHVALNPEYGNVKKTIQLLSRNEPITGIFQFSILDNDERTTVALLSNGEVGTLLLLRLPFKSSSMHWSWTGFVVYICFFDVKLVSDFQVSSFISLSRPWKFSGPIEANFPCHVKTAAIPSPVVRRNLLRVFASTSLALYLVILGIVGRIMFES